MSDSIKLSAIAKVYDFFFFFFDAGDRTHGLTHAKHVLCTLPLNYTSTVLFKSQSWTTCYKFQGTSLLPMVPPHRKFTILLDVIIRDIQTAKQSEKLTSE